MITDNPESFRPTCQYKKSNGELCRRTVETGEGLCWQHAKSWRHRWKSLTRNQSILFITSVLGVVLTGMGLVWSLEHPANGNQPRLRDVEVGTIAEAHKTTDNPTAVVSRPGQHLDWHDKGNWRRHLKVGMSKSEVRQLFGEPEKINVYSDLENWYYGSGNIEFDGQGLNYWSEPD